HHKGANVKFDIPDNWKTTIEGDTLVTKPEDGEVALEFVALEDAKDAKKAEETLMKQLTTKFTDVKVTKKAKKVKQHGIAGQEIAGTAKKGETVVEWV